MHSLTRQSDLIPERILRTPIHVIGAGAIGSFVGLALAKSGFPSLHFYDYDYITDVNICCQFYPLGAVNNDKVHELVEIISIFSGVKDAVPHFRRFDRHCTPEGVVISAVDSMESRKEIWDICKGNPQVKWLIDPRMSGEHANLYVICPNNEKDIKTYEKLLFDDSETLQERCTAKATMYTVLSLSGAVVKGVIDALTNNTRYTRMMDWNLKDNAQEVHYKPEIK